MKTVQVQAASWNRFRTRYFGVVPELLGAQQRFRFDGKTVTVELPGPDELSEDPTREGRLAILSYREEGGRKVPTQVAVASVDFRVPLDEKVEVPEEVLSRPSNAFDILSEETQGRLERLAEAYRAIAEKAFSLWIRTLRWKSHGGQIGRPEVHDEVSGWGPYLTEVGTRHRFWTTTMQFTLPHISKITVAAWHDAQDALKNRDEPPLHYDLLFDAREHYRLRDLQESVVDAALACEVYIRSKVMQGLLSGLNDAVTRYVQRAPIGLVLKGFFPETLNEQQNKTLKGIKGTLKELFDARNTIMHAGRKTDLKPNQCDNYLAATDRLITIA